MLILEHAALHDHLPNDKKYLSALFGILGPDDVMGPLIKVQLKIFLNKGLDVDAFLKNLVNLQPKLAEVARFHKLHNLPKLKYSSSIQSYQSMLDLIHQHESELLVLFGSRDQLERAIKMIIYDADNYKELGMRSKSLKINLNI
jgi:hypothetical protein